MQQIKIIIVSSQNISSICKLMIFNLFRKKEEREPQKLFYTTDIHSHILPGIDDGSPNSDISIKLLKAMTSWGLQNIIATPHITEGYFENDKSTIENAFNNLQSAIKDKFDNLTIRYSAEHRIDNKFRRLMSNNELVLLPDNYILIENSFVQPPIDLKKIIFELQLQDIKPILAHPERYEYYQHKKSIYDELIDVGCEFQVNLLSLSGYYGDREKETALWMANKGYISFIGTDLHHFEHVDVITRFLCSKEYLHIADKLKGCIKNDKLK